MKSAHYGRRTCSKVNYVRCVVDRVVRHYFYSVLFRSALLMLGALNILTVLCYVNEMHLLLFCELGYIMPVLSNTAGRSCSLQNENFSFRSVCPNRPKITTLLGVDSRMPLTSDNYVSLWHRPNYFDGFDVVGL